uniref:Uncharacterized protein n=1 Tax=Leptobrachium leishanense TaxID=445787 RepID=A0A8C5LUA5_9ANUR
MAAATPRSPDSGPATRGDIEGLLSTFRADIKRDIQEGLAAVRAEIDAVGARTDALERANDNSAKAYNEMAQHLEVLTEEVHQLQRAQEDQDNRSRRNNIRLRGVPEDVTDLQDFMHRYLLSLLPDTPPEHCLFDRVHRALRPRPRPGERPRDIIARFHYYGVKDAVVAAARTQTPSIDNVMPKLFIDLSPITLQNRRSFKPVTDLLIANNIRYRWGFPFKLVVSHHGTTHILEDLQR